jgi:hypothetical protein
MSALRVRASAANKWWRGKHRLGQLSLLLARFQGFEIAFHRFHYKPLVAGTTPPIAVDASDQHFIVVVDFH